VYEGKPASSRPKQYPVPHHGLYSSEELGNDGAAPFIDELFRIQRVPWNDALEAFLACTSVESGGIPSVRPPICHERPPELVWRRLSLGVSPPSGPQPLVWYPAISTYLSECTDLVENEPFHEHTVERLAFLEFESRKVNSPRTSRLVYPLARTRQADKWICVLPVHALPSSCVLVHGKGGSF
jgi:hypothetical protein